MHIRPLRFFSLLGCALLLGGCFNLSPAYKVPDLSPLPGVYKEDNGWHSAQPADLMDRGTWWKVFQDPILDELVAQAHAANQNIAVAAANLRQARAQVAVARSAILPGVSVPASVSRTGTAGGTRENNYSYGVSAQWEISFWNAVPAWEAAQAQAQATAADYSTMRLAVEAELASTYFQLRALDEQQKLYESTVESYKKALALTRSQLRGGIVTPMDVNQAETQYSSAEAQLAAIMRSRAECEHALAVLTGRLPSDFSLEAGSLPKKIPTIPAELPSALLERRPDIASAERQVASANQQIGLARAAWLPSLNLGASYIGKGVGLASAPVWTWAVGPSAALSIFEGGKHLAQTDAAWAAYEAEVANYRQTVLSAFKDVEDSLSALHYLATEHTAQLRTVQSSQSALRIAMSQYKGGMTTYLQVVSSQESALSAKRRAVDVQMSRLNETVSLIKALGGGFQKGDMVALLKAQ